jgi:hypothetical protein
MIKAILSLAPQALINLLQAYRMGYCGHSLRALPCPGHRMFQGIILLSLEGFISSCGLGGKK